MSYRMLRRLALALAAVLAVAVWLVAAAQADSRQITSSGTASPLAGPTAPDGGIAGPEFAGGPTDAGIPDPYNGLIDRSLSKGTGKPAGAKPDAKAKSNPEVTQSFEGLNFYQQRYANRGNQFSLEPPDQGLCVGNGYVVEATNDVFNVFNSSGASVLPDNTSTNVVSGFPRNVNHAVDLNTFYGYPAAIVRPSTYGPELTDPSCLYDAQTQRFYMVVLTLDRVGTSSALSHVNHLDIAVSKTSDPTGDWWIYKIDVTNDGSNPAPSNQCPCLGDYPHIGADANGFYITTNSYPWAGNGFDGAQIYAMSKTALATGGVATVTHFDTFGAVNAPSDAGSTQPGFTVWPSQSPGTASFDTKNNGTEYFLSSNAADEATHPVAGTGGDYTSSQIVVWALTNTASLNSVPALNLSNTLVNVNQYALPPKANQPGSGFAPTTDVPQGYCINDTTTTLYNGQMGCWRLLFGAEPAHNEVISKLDSNDTRMQQVTYANKQLWGALDTAVSFDSDSSHNKAGIAWYIIEPSASMTAVKAKVALQGTDGVPNANLIYPAVGVTDTGLGAIAMTLVGADDNPSAAYSSLDVKAGMGAVHTVAQGATQDDGFTSYKSQVGNPPRTRWGDYGSAAVDGNSIWIASEYIANPCTYTNWGGPFFAGGSGDNLLGTCAGGTYVLPAGTGTPATPGPRAALANWSTRISQLSLPAK